MGFSPLLGNYLYCVTPMYRRLESVIYFRSSDQANVVENDPESSPYYLYCARHIVNKYVAIPNLDSVDRHHSNAGRYNANHCYATWVRG